MQTYMYTRSSINLIKRRFEYWYIVFVYAHTYIHLFGSIIIGNIHAKNFKIKYST